MGKYHIPQRLPRKDTKSIDHNRRKRIEELYLLTDEILNEENNQNYKYDYKLYKKYKQLKEINKRLQEKIINQHCSGCKCHTQSNVDTDECVPCIDLTSSTNTEKKKKKSSTNNKRKTEASSEEEEEEDEEEEQMDTNDDIVVEETNEGDALACLPPVLQDIIRNKVKQSDKDKTYLLKIGLYPSLCEFLCNTSSDPKDCLLTPGHIRPLISKSLRSNGRMYQKIAFHMRKDIREIRKLYMLEVAQSQEKKDSTAKKKKENQRTSI